MHIFTYSQQSIMLIVALAFLLYDKVLLTEVDCIKKLYEK